MRKLICGKNSVLDAIKNNLPVKTLFLIKKTDIKIDENIEIKIISKKDMDKMIKSNHQGYVLELKDFNYYSLDVIIKDNPSKIIVLDRIQDTHNFGAILRSANAFGFSYIVIAKNRQTDVTPSVLKVSSGGYVGIKIIRVDSIQSAIQKMKKNGIWIYATSLENAIPIHQATFNYPMAFIFGNEGKGVSRPLLKQSDQNVYIPIKGTVQSLNVSVAAGIFLSFVK